MKKFLASSIVILVFSAYAAYQQFASTPAIRAAAAHLASSSKTLAVAGASARSAPPPASQGEYMDGTYTGSSADAYYGNVQVRVRVSGGRITDVAFLDYPQDRGTSVRINSYAIPQLTQEAIAAQSAQVDGVSGASDTSAAFKQSLASALTQARA